MAKGDRFPSEARSFRDAETGTVVRQLTNYKGHSHHLYFTNSGWYDQGRRLLFGSDRSNHRDLYSLELASGETSAVLHNRDRRGRVRVGRTDDAGPFDHRPLTHRQGTSARVRPGGCAARARSSYRTSWHEPCGSSRPGGRARREFEFDEQGAAVGKRPVVMTVRSGKFVYHDGTLCRPGAHAKQADWAMPAATDRRARRAAQLPLGPAAGL